LLRIRLNKFLRDHGEFIEHDGWRIHILDTQVKDSSNWSHDIANIMRQVKNPTELLKQDHRSFVAIFEHDNLRYVIKKFTLQNTWFWFRWTSVVFESLGEIAYRNSILMLEDGLLIPEPIMLCQKVSNLTISHSWMIYKYLDGEELGVAEMRDIVAFVKSMHHRGWVHRDPHPANFLRTTSTIATIDPIRARKSQSMYLRACDVLHMMRDNPIAGNLYNDDRLNFWLKIAQTKHNFLNIYRIVKYWLRSAFGYNARKTELK